MQMALILTSGDVLELKVSDPPPGSLEEVQTTAPSLGFCGGHCPAAHGETHEVSAGWERSITVLPPHYQKIRTSRKEMKF